MQSIYMFTGSVVLLGKDCGKVSFLVFVRCNGPITETRRCEMYGLDISGYDCSYNAPAVV